MPNAEGWLYAWLGICSIAAFYTVPWPISFLSVMPYGPFFIAGSLLYIIYSSGWSKVRGGALFVTLTLCVILSLEVRSGFINPDAISAWVVPLTVAGFFAAFLILIRFPKLIRTSRLTYRLGALTYPLYLTHAAIGSMMLKYMVPRIGVSAALLVTTIIAFVIAQALVVLVDEPARKPMAHACNRAIASFLTVVSSLRSRKEKGPVP
jgi:peptidoglycan/LPS O-acetylase OafA/YrhL